MRDRIRAQCVKMQEQLKGSARGCDLQVYNTTNAPLKRTATFCLEPGGDSPFRRSLTDDLVFGCIPVVFSRFLSNAYPWLWDGWREASSIVVPRQAFIDGDIDLFKLLSSIPSELLQLMQETISRHARRFQMSLADDRGDEIHHLLLGAKSAAEKRAKR